MTRKDYEKIAHAVYTALRYASLGNCGKPAPSTELVLENLAEQLADILANENDRFNRDRFIDACGVYSSRGLDRK